MKIEIEKREGGWFIRCGLLSADMLQWDEALGVVASLMLTGKGHYLKTDWENGLWDMKYRQMPLLPEQSESSKTFPLLLACSWRCHE